MLDLEALLGRIAVKDKDALGLLYNNINKRIYFYILTLVKDELVAQDILSDTFMQVWKSAARFEGRSKAITWILGIARNLALKYLSRKRQMESIDEHYELTNGKSEEFIERFANLELLQMGLKKLSWKHREILQLVFFEGLSYAEVSELLSIPVNTVKTRVFHAKKALRNLLSKDLKS